jgi:hypothetical protein
MGDLAQFIAMPIDRTDAGFVRGEPFKCASPQAAIERAKGRAGYPDGTTTVLGRFGTVPDELRFEDSSG